MGLLFLKVKPKSKAIERLDIFQAGLGLLDSVGVFTPRRGSYPYEKSEKPPRPVPALSFEPKTNQGLSPVA